MRRYLHSILSLLLLLLFSGLPASARKRWVVSKDGSGDFTTVQAALNAVPEGNKKRLVILIRPGVYYEKLLLDSTRNNVTLIGEDKFRTILTYNDHTGKISPRGDTISTYTSQSFLVQANGFTAQNLTFQNDAGFNSGQAVAVQVYGDQAVFRNCRFLGFQDVLFTSREGSRQYYEHCYIEGTTDFIFGAATAWFEGCQVHSKKNSHVTAAATPEGTPFGYVFNDCVLTGDSTLRNVSLGRPWRPFAAVAYLNCYMDRHILPEGWDNWKKESNEKTARYREWNSRGPGGSASRRLPWAKQLSEREAAGYTLRAVFGDWDPLRQQ